MRLLKTALLVVAIGFLTVNCLAQTGAPPQGGANQGRPVNAATTGQVTGKLIDDQNNPLSYATVTLLRKDSSVVNGDLSKDNGSFIITPTGTGNFILRIESLGLTTKYLAVSLTDDKPNKDLGKVKITQSDNTLKSVDVVAEKPVMELKVDKKVFNAEKNTTSAGGSVSDLLQNVPSVSVDADGNVSLRGKSDVTILIDGKPATMLGTDVASALQSLPAASVESVEVITNPSAKYDASGSSGIINIVTKKDGRFGMNGNITLGAGDRDKYNGNLGLNARKGKWSFFLNSSFRLNSNFNNVTTDRYNKDSAGAVTSSMHTYEHVPRNFNGNFNSIGATFDPDKYNSITLTENVNIMQFKFNDASNYSVYNDANESGVAALHQLRSSYFSGMPISSSTAIDIKHKFKKKKDEELSFDATYAVTGITKTQQYSTQNFPDSMYNTIRENAPGTGGNNSLNIWADYTDPVTKNGKFGAGFKSQFYGFNSTANPLVDTPGRPVATDSTLYANYNYTQQIHAAYVNWSDQKGKLSYQAGLRVEDAIYAGSGDVPDHATFSSNFLDLFPSAFVSYQLPNSQSIYLNYSRRTNRPGFMQLLPFKDLSNPGTVNIGNPGLAPEYINNVEFSYNKTDTKGNNIILSTYYAYTQNLIEKITRPISAADASLGLSNEIGELLSQPVNIASGTTYGVEGTGHLQFFKFWDATVNLNFFQNQLIIGNVDSAIKSYLADNSGFSWFGKVNTNFKFPKSFSLQINANYESPKVVAQGTLKDTYWIDAAIRKNFWKNKATLIFNVSDIFKTHRFITDYNLSQYYETVNRVRETRVGTLTFTYRFGKSPDQKGKYDKGDKNKQPQPNDESRENNLKDSNDDGGGGQGGGNGGGPKGGGGNGSGGGHN